MRSSPVEKNGSIDRATVLSQSSLERCLPVDFETQPAFFERHPVDVLHDRPRTVIHQDPGAKAAIVRPPDLEQGSDCPRGVRPTERRPRHPLPHADDVVRRADAKRFHQGLVCGAGHEHSTPQYCHGEHGLDRLHPCSLRVVPHSVTPCALDDLPCRRRCVAHFLDLYKSNPRASFTRTP